MAFVAVLGLVLLPTAAVAQSTIGGRVVDNTGGVLPGVTIEAASPALIEGSRVVVTDGQGQYAVINLEPGTYSVTFTLGGFSTQIRDGVDLSANFTSTVNATMTVGALEETVTVSGASPTVDVQRSTRTQVLTREVMDAIPTGRNTWTQAQLLAGVRMTGNDVGGSQYVSDLLLESHGASALHSTYSVDGMPVNSMLNDGRDQNYFQDQSNQEMSVQTSGGSAEVSAGGVQLNMIPKDGGNTFAGTFYAGGTDGRWQSDNLSPALQDQGLATVDTINRIFDYNTTVGGPIKRDKLWFFLSLRKWGVWDPPANTFLDNGDIYQPERSIFSPIVRFTYQATQSNKISFHMDRQGKSSGPVLDATYPAAGWIRARSVDFDKFVGLGVTDPETARGYQDPRTPYGVAQLKLTSVISNRLLFEAGYSMSRTYVLVKPPNGVTVAQGNSLDLAPIDQTSLWFSRVKTIDRDTNTTWNATSGTRWKPIRNTLSASMSYVTGSHSVKVGVQNAFGQNLKFLGSDQNGHLDRVEYRSGVPSAVRITNHPVVTVPRLNYDLALFAQDSWTVDRLSINAGIRMEWLNAYVGEQGAPAGRFVPARFFPRVDNVPNWFDVRPRFGVAYDLFGDARTAVKFSIGSYSTPQGTGFAERFNPMASTTRATLPWGDTDLGGAAVATNGDDIVQDNELDFGRIPTGFGTRQLNRFDPDITRENNLEYAASVQHELMEGVSLNVGYYRRQFYDQYSDDNVLRSPSDYRAVEVTSPYNGEVFTAYDLIVASSLAAEDVLVTNAGLDRSELYNGFEFAVQARLPGGGTIITSSTTQRIITSRCDEGDDDPNKLRFCDRGNLPGQYNSVPFRSDFKLAMNYPLPYDFSASFAYNSLPGRSQGDLVRVDEELPINWLVSRSTTYADGTPVIPDMVLSSVTLPLAPAGTERQLPRLDQINVGLRKVFRTPNGTTYEAAFEVFNALNASTVQSERSANFGTSAYGVPSRVLLGRLPRLSLLVSW